MRMRSSDQNLPHLFEPVENFTSFTRTGIRENLEVPSPQPQPFLLGVGGGAEEDQSCGQSFPHTNNKGLGRE
jgi:hypothetical protein